jgi:hypothetical protein
MSKYLLFTLLFMFSCGASINTEVKRSNNCDSLSGDCMDCLSSLWNKGEDKPDRKSCSACAEHDVCVAGLKVWPTKNTSVTEDKEDSDE